MVVVWGKERVLKVRLNKVLLLTLRLLGLFGLFGLLRLFGLTFGICLRRSLFVITVLGWAGLALLCGATSLIGAI